MTRRDFCLNAVGAFYAAWNAAQLAVWDRAGETGAHWLGAVEQARRGLAALPGAKGILFTRDGKEWCAARFPGGWQLLDGAGVVRHTAHERRP